VPAVRLRVPAVRLRVPAVRLRVPAVRLRVPAVRLLVPLAAFGSFFSGGCRGVSGFFRRGDVLA
jgi:hypothetical protein